MSFPLRPLGFGEIFDRAVTIYVRNFMPLSIIAAFFMLPMRAIDFAMLKSRRTDLTQIFAPTHASSATPPQIDPATTGWLVLFVLLALTLAPFVNVAIGVAVARIYATGSADWRECYAATLRRWPVLIGLTLIEICIIAGVVVVGSLALVLFIAMTIVAYGAAPVFGFAMGALTFALLLAFITFAAVCAVAISFMFYSAGIEGAGLGPAVSSGFARVFNRAEFWRACLVALAIFAVQIGVSIVSLALFGVLTYTHSALLYEVVSGLIGLVSVAFLAALIGVYYFDVRVRREGLDMESNIQRLLQTAPA
jgi:MFS family permease